MDLTDADIKEFIDLWEEEFGERISPDRAREEAKRLLDLFWMLAKHRPPERGHEDGPTE